MPIVQVPMEKKDIDFLKNSTLQSAGTKAIKCAIQDYYLLKGSDERMREKVRDLEVEVRHLKSVISKIDIAARDVLEITTQGDLLK